MSFIYSKYLVFIFFASFVFGFFLVKKSNSFFNWVESHWLYKRNKNSKRVLFFYWVSLLGLGLSLLDLRGENQLEKTKVQKHKTIILLDVSSSMRVQDIKPSRLDKALFFARHFVKKSQNHDIALLTFSDQVARIVPFTYDKDFLDSRLVGFSAEQTSGGSDIRLGIDQAILYFKQSQKSQNGRVSGNILILTDAEENANSPVEKTDEDINIGMIVFNTERGGTIPELHNPQENKKFKGEVIISKLDLSYLQKISEKIKNFKYWRMSSYSLPTEEVLTFFNQSAKAISSEDEANSREPLAHYLLIPSFILLLISLVFRALPQFFILTLFLSYPIYSEEKIEIQKMIDKLKKNKLSEMEKLFLADHMSSQKNSSLALSLYEENKGIYSQWSFNTKNNYATALLEKGDTPKGLQYYSSLLEDGSLTEDQKNNIRSNILLSIQKKNQQEKKSEDANNKKEQDQKNQQQNKQEDKQESKEPVAGILNQLLNEDRELQKKIIEVLQQKNNGKQEKDW